MPRLAELRAAGADLANLDTGEPLGDRPVLTANAYLGGWGIAEALARGADIVITGRVTDAALAVGPAAWHHGWRRDDWDALAGAVVAGHVIECGAQATGGNFAFFTEVPGLGASRLPDRRGGRRRVRRSSPSTPVTAGMVSADTVTAQLLYEIGGPAYLNPDVTARFDSIRLWPPTARTGCGSPGCAGDSPPATTKVALNYQGGWRSTAHPVPDRAGHRGKGSPGRAGAVGGAYPAGGTRSTAVDVSLLRTDKPDPATNAEAMAQLRITVKDSDERARSAGPSPPGSPSWRWPRIRVMFGDGLISGAACVRRVLAGAGARVGVRSAGSGDRRPSGRSSSRSTLPPQPRGAWRRCRPCRGRRGARQPGERARRRSAGSPAPGRGTRAATPTSACGRVPDAGYAWLAGFLTVDEAEANCCRRRRRSRWTAMSCRTCGRSTSSSHGLLGEGVAASTRLDPQAKSLGEWLRARVVDCPGADATWS